jgi:hypothetical protein
MPPVSRPVANRGASDSSALTPVSARCQLRGKLRLSPRRWQAKPEPRAVGGSRSSFRRKPRAPGGAEGEARCQRRRGVARAPAERRVLAPALRATPLQRAGEGQWRPDLPATAGGPPRLHEPGVDFGFPSPSTSLRRCWQTITVAGKVGFFTAKDAKDAKDAKGAKDAQRGEVLFLQAPGWRLQPQGRRRNDDNRSFEAFELCPGPAVPRCTPAGIKIS